MKTEKLKYVPVNILFSMPVASGVFIILNSVLGIVFEKAIFLSVLFFCWDILNQSRLDYIEEEVNKLKIKTGKIV
jgi:hypothetical protein